MTSQEPENAADRIDRALARIERAAARLHDRHGALATRHAALRQEVLGVVGALDELIDDEDAD